MIKLLLKAIRDSGCVSQAPAIDCVDSPARLLGLWDPERLKVRRVGRPASVAVCARVQCDATAWFSPQVEVNVRYADSKETVLRTVTHELIHAYDACRVDIDYNNCRHIACTEVRAANLSTDCNFKNEFKLMNWRIQGQQKVCSAPCVAVWLWLRVRARVCVCV
jgi:hypothetical protein